MRSLDLTSAVVVCLAMAGALHSAEKDKAASTETVPGSVVDYLPAAGRQFAGSPALAVLPNGDYVASHDLFGPKSTERTSAVTKVFSSSDKGKTWKHLTDLQGQFWSSLFVHNGSLYIIGTEKHYGPIIIRRSDDGGKTWTEPKDKDSGRLHEGFTEGNDKFFFHCAPVPVVVHNGRIWRGIEAAIPTPKWGGNFYPTMMSAPVDADLLKSSSWTMCKKMDQDLKWLDGKFGGWLEGNAVVTPEGKIVDILRVHTPDFTEKAAIINISDDGKTGSFDPKTGFVDFFGGSKKFTIRFDPKSKLYWSLVNYVPADFREHLEFVAEFVGTKKKHLRYYIDRVVAHPASVRNTLALVSSPDLKTWTLNGIVLQHADVEKHAFQYVDWLFEGDDIILLSRTAFGKGDEAADSAHNANYITFHRISDFRNFKTEILE
jgi:hypothetical protein